MMKSRSSSLEEIENQIGSKTYLEFAVFLLELGFFNPIVFCHDNGNYDKQKYSQVMIGFINLLSFLYSCGMAVETELYIPNDTEVELYRNIMCESDAPESIICYELLDADFTELNLQDAVEPENCECGTFALVKIYLYLRTGATINRKVVERILDRRITDIEMVTLRNQLENITGRKIVKRKDNSYEMR